MSEKVLRLPRKRGPDVLRLAPSGRSLAIGVGLLLAAIGLYALARGTSMFAVQAIEVEGASPALVADVRAELSSFEGRSLVAVNGDSVAQRVDGLPAVRSATVDRAFPHGLRIESFRRFPSQFFVAAPTRGSSRHAAA